MPNPPVPAERKRARGNPGKRPLADRSTVIALPGAGSEAPDPPRPLGPEGRKMWERIWQAGRAWVSTGSDLDVVLLLCESMDERVALRVRVLRGDGDWRDRVALRHLDAQISSLLGQLAFTPTERARLGMAEVKHASPLEELLAKRSQRG